MIIAADGLWKHYRACEAVKDLSFSVPEGSAFALIGANGAGKTTTIRLLLNLIRPSRGRATLLGVDSLRLSPEQFRHIGYVAQDQKLPRRFSIAGWLDYLRPFYPSWDRTLEKSLLDRFDLPPERRIGVLSHGMRMKLMFLSALCYRPKLLILDEPFAGIDVTVRDDLTDGLLSQAGETTIFLSSHDLDEIERLITDMAFLQEGRLLFQDSIEKMQARFRAVRLMFDNNIALPNPFPPSWLDARADGRVLSFVMQDGRDDDAVAQASALLGPPRDIDIVPMSLREMFTAMVRTRKKRA